MSLKPNQRRTVIIRGRSQNEMDTMLPIFANLVERNTPLDPDKFDSEMIKNLKVIFPEQTNKTHRNYLTEIIGQLFSMYYIEKGNVVLAPLTLKLIEDGDQPAFFKVLISKLQFPNPSAKKHKYDEEVSDKLAVKPLVLVLDLIKVANDNGDSVAFEEIAYFVLNSAEALRGEHTGQSIYADIIKSRLASAILPEFNGSNERQHIKEALNLLILANLIRTDSHKYWLNILEDEAISEILGKGSQVNLFRIRNSFESHEDFQQEWKKYLTDVSDVDYVTYATNIESLGQTSPQKLISGKPRRRSTDIGREGELLVLDIENTAIEISFPGNGYRAKDYTSKRGIGFDIESIFHNEPELNGTTHRIEVKSTIRVTKPNIKGTSTPDSFSLTRSEKQAIETYKETFSIYRVYIYSGGYDVHVLRNPSELSKNSGLRFIPDTWTAEYIPSDLPSSLPLLEEIIQ